MKAHPHPAFALLVAQAEALALPERFATDLTNHDAHALRAMDHAQPFAWLVHPDGTHLVRLATEPERKQRRSHYSVGELIGFIYEQGAERGQGFVWDGRELRPVRNAEEMRERLGAVRAQTGRVS